MFPVQGESSTGTHQALGGGLGAACKAAGTLLVVDTVAAQGGVPMFADEWGIDAVSVAATALCACWLRCAC